MSTRVFVTGHRGLVGSALVRALENHPDLELVTADRQLVDLEDQHDVRSFLSREMPNLVIHCAGKVGGVLANKNYPADFISRNLIMAHNVIWGSHLSEVANLIFLASSCAYPREADQPIKESALLTGSLEPTNEPFAIAKIAGISMCNSISSQYGRDYVSIMLPNIYGPNDQFDPLTSHVLPALIRKFHEALPDQPVELWGTGSPIREFLHADDVASACLFLATKPEKPRLINVGTGRSVTIRELAQLIRRITNHTGPIRWNRAMPDGFPAKTMDVSTLFGMGWRPSIGLEEGIRETYRWFRDAQNSQIAIRAH